MTAVPLTCPVNFGDRRLCQGECCAEYNARLKEHIATHGRCVSCKHWGSDGRRKSNQLCALITRDDSPLEIYRDGCEECCTDNPATVYTPPRFGCNRWAPR